MYELLPPNTFAFRIRMVMVVDRYGSENEMFVRRCAVMDRSLSARSTFCCA